MSEYLDRPARTVEEVLADIRKIQDRYLLAMTNRVIRLTERMQETTK